MTKDEANDVLAYIVSHTRLGPFYQEKGEQALAALSSPCAICGGGEPIAEGWVAESDLKLGPQLGQLSIWYSQKVLDRITHQSRHVIVLSAEETA